MRASRRALLVGATASAALATAGPAFGATYCVHQTGSCAAGQVDKGADLQQALTEAAAADSTVLVGPGTYAHSSGFSVSTTNALTVTGAGRGQTILRTSGAGGTIMTFSAPTGSVLQAMTFAMDSHAGIGLLINQATARDVEDVLEPSATSSAVGAFVTGGATVRDSTLQGSTASASGAGAEVGNSTPLFDHDMLSGYYGIKDEGGPAKLQRSTLTESVYPIGVSGSGANLVADDNLVLLGSGGPGQIGINVTEGGSATVRSTTIYSVFGVGRGAASDASSSGDHTSLTLLDSILWNLPTAFVASASAGTSSITANYDDVNGSIGGGTNADVSMSNDVHGDPLFVNPGSGNDYRLRFGSPAIDTGGDCAAICQTVPDLAGLVRPIDGNGDGIATRDMGAYEYARQPPSAAASSDRSSALTSELLAFSGAGSSDPDPGDALTYAWSFDDGTTASGQAVTHAFTTAGPHTATLTVTDPTGLTATATATVVVSAPLVVTDTVAPALSKVSLSPSTFAVASGSTAVSAKRHRGTRIRFELSEAAKVVATFERKTAGIRSGKRCVAKSRKHRHGKACTRYVRAGTLTRRSEPAGADAIAFTGRLGKHRLAAGRYRMRLRATDAAGNGSREETASFRIV
jgi:hypothetical protein